MAKRESAARKWVIRVLYAGATSLNLSSTHIKKVPKCVSRLTNLSVLLLNNNSITGLPTELLSLHQLAELNLGNNALKEFPAVLGHLESLKKRYLFRNQITVVPPDVIGGFKNLVVLNLNHNQIQRLPPGIISLTMLEHLSLLDNKLEEVPAELGHLTRLSEINLNFNKLSRLPRQLYQCKELTKLYMARNYLTSLPEEGSHKIPHQLPVEFSTFFLFFSFLFFSFLFFSFLFFSFLVLVNKYQEFQKNQLAVTELHCEGNRFVQCELMTSVQYAEVLILKEVVVRFVLREDRNRFSLIHVMLPHYPNLKTLLDTANSCAVCCSPFLTTWLHCVHFVNLKKDMKMRSMLTILVHALLCSYRCFNTEGHAYFGVATR
ncbi:LOW QUALITY PROTEIN: leucine-rich repeat-containing protein 69 [Neolamprologus brichardi]|uniref:LOW QUALITY PROTEIN: leucine-rich repeat-containing protein 69 n=1 Tax=Neolamprologus brichardi TaxID=32507 RepID=UPI001643E28A|nr:LOW QUALITY PROTEIN: leucine-rich repeat-containing protein 69 [Neolamprologus brichardi]